MKKYFLLFLLLITGILIFSFPAWAGEIDNESEQVAPLETTLKNLNLSVFDEYKKNIDRRNKLQHEGKNSKRTADGFQPGPVGDKNPV